MVIINRPMARKSDNAAAAAGWKLEIAISCNVRDSWEIFVLGGFLVRQLLPEGVRPSGHWRVRNGLPMVKRAKLFACWIGCRWEREEVPTKPNDPSRLPLLLDLVHVLLLLLLLTLHIHIAEMLWKRNRFFRKRQRKIMSKRTFHIHFLTNDTEYNIRTFTIRFTLTK